jgi:hypothetical protein
MAKAQAMLEVITTLIKSAFIAILAVLGEVRLRLLFLVHFGFIVSRLKAANPVNTSNHVRVTEMNEAHVL